MQSILLNQEALQKAGIKPFGFLKAIAELPYVEAIYLFGSRARGDFREHSDIDLAVKYSDDEKWHRKVVKAIISEYADTFLKIDLVDYNTKKPGKKLFEFIDKEKVTLYAKP